MACNCTGACRRYGTCSGLPPVGYQGVYIPAYIPPYSLAPEAPRGCICPPTSEQTCQSQFCPRKAVQAFTVVASAPANGSAA